VSKIDGRTIDGEVPGPVTMRLSALYRELTASEGFAVV
jgi:hypothetical protein